MFRRYEKRSFWRTYPVACIWLVVLVACLIVLLAYGYRPQAAEEQASYFREKEFSFLDTQRFIFNSHKAGTGQPVVLIHDAGAMRSRTA